MSEKCAAVILATEENPSITTYRSIYMMNLLSKPIVGWVITALRRCGIEDISVVVSDNDVTITPYVELLGCASYKRKQIENESIDFMKKHCEGNILVVRGDAPFIDPIVLRNALLEHGNNGNEVTVVSTQVDVPFGYSRIVRGALGELLSVVEEKHASADEKKIREVSSGSYWFDAIMLLRSLESCVKFHKDAVDNAVNEIMAFGGKVGAYYADSPDIVLRASNRRRLLTLNEKARKNEILRHIEAGVDIPCIDGVMIESDVEIGVGTTILPGTILRGKVKIGKGCKIGPNTLIENSTVGDNVILNETQCYQSTVKNGCNIGPFAHIRPNSVVGDSVHLGNFVEVKNSSIDTGTKVSHLTYVGDSDVGKHVNFGCGTVTVNYTGRAKFRTKIMDDAFIGCNTNLVAPVTVGAGAYTAAGSTITEDVPDSSLGIARARQVNKLGWRINKDNE